VDHADDKEPFSVRTPIAAIAALAPERLVERLAALADERHLANAANTRRAWRASWRVWVAFCAETNTGGYPPLWTRYARFCRRGLRPAYGARRLS